MQRIGSAIGIAVVSSVLFGVANLAGVAGEIKERVAAAVKEGTYATPELAGEAISRMVLESHFMDGATIAMFVSAIFALVALVLVFALPKRVNLH